MPRYSANVAMLSEHRRQDGSSYLIGTWLGLRVFVEEAGDGWAMHLSEHYPNQMRNQAAHFEAVADAHTRSQFDQVTRGDGNAAQRSAARARLNGAIAKTLREERENGS